MHTQDKTDPNKCENCISKNNATTAYRIYTLFKIFACIWTILIFAFALYLQFG